MNYTKPNNLDNTDKPEDWLNSALIFTRTLSLILDDNTGIVVELKGDMKNPINPNSNRVVVFYKDNMIHIDDIQDESLVEGDFIQIKNEK
jgi:predicted phosphatase